ncbi:MAG TPA: hypothetical protein GXZ89_00425 [Fastidiosipila sp.]|nr:hypothetical protein [Fastidiosipila sp.]
MSVLFSIALLFSLLFSPVASVAPPAKIDVSDDIAIVSFLANVPADAFDQGYLSYVNFQAMVDAHPDASLLPEDMTLETWRDTPEGKAWIQTMLSIGGSSLIRMYAGLADETFELTGMHPLRVQESLHAGLSIDMEHWLRGNIDKEQVIKVLEANDYVAEAAQDESGWVLLCENGDCSKGFTFDKEKRNDAFIFGGNLGRRWPIAVKDDLLVSAQLEETFRTATEPVEHSLIDLMTVSRPISVVLSSIEDDGDASISQMLMHKPEQFFWMPGQGANIKSLGMFHTNGKEAQRVIFTLTFNSTAEAEEARQQIEEAYQTAEEIKRLFSEAVDEIDGVKEDLYIDSTEDDAVLIVPFRFKTTAQLLEDGKLQSSFIFFTRLQLSDHLRWLAPLDADTPTMPSIN